MERVRHFFLPHHPRHRKAHALRPPGLLLYIGFLLLLNLSFQLLVRVKPGVLGFSSSITADELIALVNEERRSHGLPSLKVNQELTLAAGAKGQDMFSHNYWSHVSPSGVDPWTWIKQVGYDYQYAGENLAKDFGDSASVVRAWMNSPSHRDNILNHQFDEIGVVVLDGVLTGYQTTLVVEMFGTPKPTPALAKARPSPASPVPEAAAPQAQVAGLIQPSRSEPPALAGLDTRLLTQKPLSRTPLIDSFAVVRSTSVSLIFLLLGIVGLDVILVSRRRIVRIGSHSLAHAVMLGVLLVAVWYTQVGVIL